MSAPQASQRPLLPERLAGQMTPELKAFVDSLIAFYEERMAQLEAKLLQLTPQNSSRPPSSQHPHAKPKPKPKAKGRSKKKPGGQPGHPKHQRDLLPSEQCQEVHELKPQGCRRCGQALQGEDPDPQIHQVWELPPIQPLIIEYRLARLKCPCCGITTQAALPAGVPRGQSGPRLVALASLLMGYYRLSKRRTAQFVEDVFEIPCSPGLVVKMQTQTAQALEEPYQEIQEHIRTQPQVFMDETPTKEANQKAWLWVVVAPAVALFAIFSSRKAQALPRMLGVGYRAKIIHCDRAKMYWRAPQLQWCWAHLRRDVQALVDHSDRTLKRLGTDLRREIRRMFGYWHRYKEGEISWGTFQTYMRPVRRTIEALLRRGQNSGHPRLVGMCKELYTHRDWLWTFTRVEGVEPTNNTAERALRPAVIWRKLSFGTQSEKGSRFMERMLSVTETCRLQKRSIFEYVLQAVEAHFSKTKPPSLISDR